VHVALRSFREEDLEAVLSLQKRAMEPTGAYKGPGPWEDDLKDIRGHYLGNRGEFLVGYDGATLACMGAFRRVAPDVAEVKRMRTEPALQGRGLGKLVLRRLEERAVEMGYARMILETGRVQVAARALYEGAGFVFVRDEVIDGVPCRWYEKELG